MVQDAPALSNILSCKASLNISSTFHSPFLAPLLFVTHFLAFTSTSAGLLIGRAPTSPVISSATRFHPGKCPPPWAPGGHSNKHIAEPTLVPSDRGRIPPRSRLKEMSTGVKTWLAAVCFLVCFSVCLSTCKALVRFPSTCELWRQDFLGTPKFMLYSHCATLSLCYCLTLLWPRRQLEFLTIYVLYPLKVTYAHNKKYKHYQRAYKEKQAHPPPLPALLLRGKSFQWLLLGVPSYLIYRLSKFILSKHFQSTLCYERWGSTQTKLLCSHSHYFYLCKVK